MHPLFLPKRNTFIASLVLLGFVLFYLRGPTLPEHCFSIAPGTTAASVYQNLHNTFHLKLSWMNYSRFRLLTLGSELKHGEYCTNQTAYWSLLSAISHGEVQHHSITIFPGYNHYQLWSFIHDHHPLLDEAGLAEKIKRYKHQLLPETYDYIYGQSISDILMLANDHFEKTMKPIWKHRDNELSHYSFEQIITIASLIEKEAKGEGDRKRIAGVIYNRLNKMMPLQIDATVVYAFMREYAQGESLSKLIRNTHPMNTYRHKGLPPESIAMVSQASFYAACHPLHHDDYYYVFNGKEHLFAKNYQEHLEQIKKIKQSSQE